MQISTTPMDVSILKTDEKVAYTLRSLYRRFGYCQYKMSKFEEYALYVRHKDFLVSDGIISFTDTSGRLLALKPDVTLSIIHNSKDETGTIQKLYYDENVYRISKSSHTYKEIKQTGLECIGDVGEFELCEVLHLAIRSLSEISKDYVLELSHVGLLDAVLAQCELTPSKEKEILRCISLKSEDELSALCLRENLSNAVQNTLSVFLSRYDNFDKALLALEPICHSEAAKVQLEQLRRVLAFLSEMGAENSVKVDFSLSNAMKYYSGVAFRGYIKGIPTGVLSGGQYDKLMRKLGRKSGAIGFAVYLDTLERLEPTESRYDVDILLLHGGNPAAALKAAEALSENGTTVRICETVPSGIRYRSLLNLGEKGDASPNGND